MSITGNNSVHWTFWVTAVKVAVKDNETNYVVYSGVHDYASKNNGHLQVTRCRL